MTYYFLNVTMPQNDTGDIAPSFRTTRLILEFLHLKGLTKTFSTLAQKLESDYYYYLSIVKNGLDNPHHPSWPYSIETEIR